MPGLYGRASGSLARSAPDEGTAARPRAGSAHPTRCPQASSYAQRTVTYGSACASRAPQTEQTACYQQYGGAGLPSSFLIGPQGTLVTMWRPGAITREMLDRDVTPLLRG